MRTKSKEKLEKDFYEEVLFVGLDKNAKTLYRISEKDSMKGIRITFYDIERGLISEYKIDKEDNFKW